MSLSAAYICNSKTERMIAVAAFIEKINRFGSPIVILLLLVTGVYLTVGSGFFQLRHFGDILRETLLSLFKKEKAGQGKNGITPFQAVSTALAGTLGTGNIVGVATAIVSGGPGAVFWMIAAAFLGMIIKSAEVLLSVVFQEKDRSGQLHGGPMYYMERGLGAPKLGRLFACLCLLASFGIGNIAQAHSVSAALESAFHWDKIGSGLLLAVPVGLAIFGGAKKITKICEKLVPFMALFYLGACLLVLGVHFRRLPTACEMILQSACGFRSAAGGMLGYTFSSAVRFGVFRGIFTNEAGLGSAPIAHGSAVTDSAVKQGMWGVFEVFLDTVVMCSLTALVILTSGLWDCGLDGAALTTAAFSAVLGRYASAFIAISILLFAVASMLGWYYYGVCCLRYLSAKPYLTRLYQAAFLSACVIGSSAELYFVWAAADCLNLLMLLPNTLSLLLLSPVVLRQTEKYRKEKCR